MRRFMQLFNFLHHVVVGRFVMLFLIYSRTGGSQPFRGPCAALRGSDKSAHRYDGILEDALQQACRRVVDYVACMERGAGRARYS